GLRPPGRVAAFRPRRLPETAVARAPGLPCAAAADRPATPAPGAGETGHADRVADAPRVGLSARRGRSGSRAIAPGPRAVQRPRRAIPSFSADRRVGPRGVVAVAFDPLLPPPELPAPEDRKENIMNRFPPGPKDRLFGLSLALRARRNPLSF